MFCLHRNAPYDIAIANEDIHLFIGSSKCPTGEYIKIQKNIKQYYFWVQKNEKVLKMYTTELCCTLKVPWKMNYWHPKIPNNAKPKPTFWDNVPYKNNTFWWYNSAKMSQIANLIWPNARWGWTTNLRLQAAVMA